MASRGTTAEGLSILQSAFAPLRCVAELYDYQSKARFRVFGTSDEPLLRMEAIELFVLGDRRLLSEIIEGARSRLVKRGIALRVWLMPQLGQSSPESYKE